MKDEKKPFVWPSMDEEVVLTVEQAESIERALRREPVKVKTRELPSRKNKKKEE